MSTVVTPPKRILIVQGHPDGDPARLCRGLADAYAEGAAEAGHELRRIDLATLDFPLLRSQSAYEKEPIPAVLEPAVEAIRWADHLVFVFPLWLGTMPALLKGFLEQVLRPGGAFLYLEEAGPQSLLAGKTARLIVTMGMPSLLFRLWYRAHGIAAMRRNILGFVGIRVVRQSLFGMVTAARDETRRGWLDQIRSAGRRGN
ncbi:NAD(P)H-dependent oxidoreductase [Zavarzinia sp.]|uniref:NAD(P)H-dependent oxidoreductase n=1 Tax=Zavarzinia sp. TaxID=2027920 RepID=UPI003566C320